MSSDSSKLSSDSSKLSQDSDVEEIMKMDESKVDKIEVKLEPYPKLEGDGNKEHYQGLEYGLPITPIPQSRDVIYSWIKHIEWAFSS